MDRRKEKHHKEKRLTAPKSIWNLQQETVLLSLQSFETSIDPKKNGTLAAHQAFEQVSYDRQGWPQDPRGRHEKRSQQKSVQYIHI